ncbi:MAG: hypothetical protein HN509_03120, partial [Halobacteriovoraceae bacterium]|nr:hypothetical protein [Halobacteriovoraceae bacterium]
MKFSIQIIFLVLMVALSSCVPSSSGGKRTKKSDSSSSSGGVVGTPAPPVFNSDEDLFWFSDQKVTGTITINQNTQTVIYLRGDILHQFLENDSNFTKAFCMVVSYTDATVKKHLRARAVPIAFTNFSTQSLERLLRIDIPEDGLNVDNCKGDASHIDSSGNIDPIAINESLSVNTNAAFSPPTMCASGICSGTISSSNVSLYTTTAGVGLSVLNRIPQESLDLLGLGLRVDVESNSSNPGSTCSNSSCLAKGFDCCLEGQCVNDATQKPNATNEPDFTQALADIAINPANFVNYPNIFFVCNSPPPPAPTPSPLPDASATASAYLEQQVAKFNCLEGEQQNPQDFSTCGDQNADTLIDIEDFKLIRADVWDECGCEFDPFPSEPNEPQCPDFGLQATKDFNGNITEVTCLVPNPSIEPTPFQNLNLSVPGRSAPHRFYRSDDGVVVDDISTLTNITPEVLPEGTPFSYLDSSGKTDPVSGTYSMNAILGQFSVSLTQALPAKVVNVEFDQTYIISVTQGFHTPCPQCASDSWFNSFSPFPTSLGGNGLGAVGHTTSRDIYNNNTSNGNYEDTIFGRACWLPPTMLPFSHKKNGNLITQRSNRLSAQSAMYVNGYQRDWFGFNKGALIGSFDGASWFAVGTGRRISAKSNKLYLAINAPFADLHEPTDHIVAIVTDQGNNIAADFDYDPNLPINDSRQNKGASCQFYHQCNTDLDCVTKLGWEYACADTSEYKTKWPRFDINGLEVKDQEVAAGGISDILRGNLPTGTNFRCVYRGAGSPCKKDLSTLSGFPQKQKLFRCAPNFYCEQINGNKFNSRVHRTPNLLETNLFGQGASVMGRPESYIGGVGTLPSEIQDAIKDSASIHTPNPTDQQDWGLCRPGRQLNIDPIEQHRNPDSTGRADYISQISNCDSKAIGDSRIHNCPVIDMGTTTTAGSILAESTNTTQKHVQNMCGGESQRDPGTTIFESTFKTIEAEKLGTVANILAPTLAADACLRRAGAVCHTDLDCGPNKLHSAQAIFFDIDAFGNTEAEQKFWQESLVCGQGQDKPFLQDDDFFDYDLTKNRCCRATGEDITMYTEIRAALQVTTDALSPGYGTFNGPLASHLPPFQNPTTDGRYSRYMVTELVSTPTSPDADKSKAEAPRIQENQVSHNMQWKAINDTGTKTCCGGGWVRKFSDGTNDWSNNKRLNVNFSAFSCINYSTDLVNNAPTNLNFQNYNKEFDKLCLAPSDGGCIQHKIPEVVGFEVQNPSNFGSQTAVLDTSPQGDPTQGELDQTKTMETPYQPIPYNGNIPVISGDGPFNYFASHDFEEATSFYLPAYIGGIENITDVTFRYFDQNGTLLGTTPGLTPAASCAPIVNNPRIDLATTGPWIVCPDTINTPGKFDVFHAKADAGLQFGGNDWAFAGVQITFNVTSRNAYDYQAGVGVTNNAAIAGFNPGNALYYLTKLGRLELIGIPQIYYEPIYCNTNRTELVSDIFDLPTQDKATFDANSFGYTVFDDNAGSLSQIYDPASPGIGADPA